MQGPLKCSQKGIGFRGLGFRVQGFRVQGVQTLLEETETTGLCNGNMKGVCRA